MLKTILLNIHSVKPEKCEIFDKSRFQGGPAESFAKSLDFYETLFRAVQIFGIIQIFEISKGNAGICQLFSKI